MSDAPMTGPIDLPVEQGFWRNMFLSLRERSFRIFSLGQGSSVTGIWMQRMTQSWMVLELTGSVTIVGLLAIFQFGPVILFGLWGGVIADRRSARRILIIAQYGIVAVGALLSVLCFAGWLDTLTLFACATFMGLCSTLEQPARQVFVNELVGPRHLSNAIAMNQSTFQIGTMLGSALGAALIPIGAGWAFLVSATLASIHLACLNLIRPHALYPRELARPAKGMIVEGLRYSLRTPEVFWVLITLVFVGSLGLNWPILFVAFADRVFETGSAGYGLYNTALAAGAIAGAFFALRRSRVTMRSFVLGCASILALAAVAAAMPWSWAFAAVIFLTSGAVVLMWTASNPLLQNSSDSRIRGRVMALYMLIATGGPAVGGPLVGWLVELIGARWAMATASLVPLAALGILVLLRRRQLKLRTAGP